MAHTLLDASIPARRRSRASALSRRSWRRSLSLSVLLLLAGAGGDHSVLRGAPSVFPTGVTVHDPTKAFQGFNLYVDPSLGGPSVGTILLLDMAGQQVHSWLSPVAGATEIGLAEPLENGNVLARVRYPGLGDTVLVEMDWDGNLVWQYAPPSDTVIHHDFERLANGNTLVLVRRRESLPAIGPNEFQDDVIQEVDPSGQVVWEWSTAEHYESLPFSDVERSYIGLANRQMKGNLFHSNAISTLPANPHSATDPRFTPGNILLSQRDTSKVFLIEPTTGEVVWFTAIALGQHQPYMLDASVAGGGNILMLDNGGESGYPTRSRLWSQVLEIDPPSGVPVWTYEAADSGLRNPEAFFGPFMGGAQRLPNGNTLVTESRWGRAFEIDSAGEIVWEYVSPRDISIYRLMRVDPSWPPLGPRGDRDRRDRDRLGRDPLDRDPLDRDLRVPGR